MGVPGLLRWLLEVHKLGAGYANRPLGDLVKGERDTFVIDGNGWAISMHSWGGSSIDVCAGGHWLLLYERVEAFLTALTAAGGRAVFVFDSVRSQAKRGQLRRRRWDASLGMWGLQKLCCESPHADFWYSQRLLEAVRTSRMQPAHLTDVAGALLCHLRGRFSVEVYDAAPGVDADLGAVAYCLRHPGRIAGIISNDNDFFLLPHGCYVVGINLPRNPGQAITMTHAVYQPRVAQLLGGKVCLPLFAALAGCDLSRSYFDYARVASSGPVRSNSLRLTSIMELVKQTLAETKTSPSPIPTAGSSEEPQSRDGEVVDPTQLLQKVDEEEDGEEIKDEDDGDEEDEDEAAAPGPEVMALVSDPCRAALERLAQTLQNPRDRQPFLWAGLQAAAFFSGRAPGYGDWPLLPYPAMPPVPDGFSTLLAASIGEGFVAGFPAVHQLAVALEYFKAARGATPLAVRSRVAYTTERAVMPEAYRLVGPAMPGTSPPDRLSVWFAKFHPHTVVLPDDMEPICCAAMLRDASAVELFAHLFAPNTSLHALLDVEDGDRVFLMALYFMLRHRLVTTKQIPVVVSMYALSQLMICIRPEEAYRIQHPDAPYGPAAGQHVFVSHIGKTWTVVEIMARLRAKDIAPAEVAALALHPTGGWKTCLLRYDTPEQAVEAQQRMSGRRDLGADCLWCVIPRQEPVMCAKGMLLASAVQPVLHLAYQLNRCLLAFPAVQYEPWRFFNGLTFQMLQIDYDGTTARWGTPATAARVDHLLRVVREHFPRHPAPKGYVHECWPYDKRVAMMDLPAKADAPIVRSRGALKAKQGKGGSQPVPTPAPNAAARPKRWGRCLLPSLAVLGVLLSALVALPHPPPRRDSTQPAPRH